MNGVLSPWNRDQYDADESRVRSTRMKDLVSPQGPRAYWLKHLRAREPELSDPNDDYSPKVGPRVLGHLFHELLLDGEVGWFACKAKRGSLDWKIACRRNAGLVALSEKDDAMLWGWRESVLRNPEAVEWLEAGGYPEQVILWEQRVIFTDDDGIEREVLIPAKCAIDKLLFTGQYGCFKTTRAADPNDEWTRELEKHNYPFSAAFYLLGIQSIPDFANLNYAEPMSHIILCKQEPYYCYVKPLSREYMMFGMGQVATAFKRYALCMHRQNELGMDPLAAWPDMLERNQLDPATPSMRAMERYGKLAGEAV